MQFIIIIIISIITIFLLKYGFNVKVKDIKKIKEIGYDKELNKIANKFPKNKEICEDILKQLKNTNVKIEENAESKTSLYIALTNKIIIADINDTFSRIQTIAHECCHSIQNRATLIFNFVFSNVFILYFLVALGLILLDIGNSLLFIQIFTIMTLIYCSIKCYLETEAMTKARYVAKEYMQNYLKIKNTFEINKLETYSNLSQTNNVVTAVKTEKLQNTENSNNMPSQEDADLLVEKFDEINKVGIPATIFFIIVENLVKIIILCVGALI